MWDHLQNVLTISVVFIPIHQALIEIYKLLGPKARRYWEALAYIVYGEEMRPKAVEKWSRTWTDAVTGFFLSVPTTLHPDFRKEWSQGPQARLIQSFLVRAVGDSPVTEISDADIRNVAQIARAVAPPEIRRTSETVDEIIRSTPMKLDVAIEMLKALPDTNAAVNTMVTGWIAVLQDLKERGVSDVAIPGLFMVWRNQFVEQFLRGVVRAEQELANAIKAAEFRYHRELHSISVLIAGIEALLISLWLVPPADGTLRGILPAFAFTFGTLILAPRGTKSLLDAVIGIGSRLKG